MPQFDLNYFPSQIFWLIVVFSFMYLIVSKFIAPAAENIFSRRKMISEDNTAKAESLMSQANKLKLQYENDYNKIWLDVKSLNADAAKKLNSSYEEQKAALNRKINEREQVLNLEISEQIKAFKNNEQELVINTAKIIIEKIAHINVKNEVLLNIYKDLISKA